MPAKRKAPARVTRSISFPKALLPVVKRAAKKIRRSPNWLVVEATRDYILRNP